MHYASALGMRDLDRRRTLALDTVNPPTLHQVRSDMVKSGNEANRQSIKLVLSAEIEFMEAGDRTGDLDW